jgi:hypothetical protein
MMTLHHTRVDDVVPEEIQDVLQAGFAMHDSHLYALHPTPFLVFFDLPRGQPLRPAQERPPGPTWGAGGRGRRATAKGCEDDRLLTLVGIGDDRREMPPDAADSWHR